MGKTTILLRIIDFIRKEDLVVGGIISKEVRVRGERKGFELINLKTGERSVLSSTSQANGPKMGKYQVNLFSLAEGGATALRSSIATSAITVCDEIGPMEMISPEFRSAVEYIVDSGKPVIGTINTRSKDPLLRRIRSKAHVNIFELTFSNREKVFFKLVNEILGALRDNV